MKKFYHIFVRHIFVRHIACAMLTCGSSVHAEDRPSIPSGAFSDFVSKNPASLKETDITSALAKGLAPPAEFAKREYSYRDLVSYYRAQLEVFKVQFPEVNAKPDFINVLRPFSGKSKLSSYDVYALPFVLLTPERTFVPSELTFARLETSFQGRTVTGLSARVRMLPKDMFGIKRRKLPGYSALTMPYICTLNARVFGFMLGRFVPQLSTPNFLPSEQWEYNGLHDWSEHPAHSKQTQLTQAIKLGNVAHPAYERYVVSPHPDFALQTDPESGKTAVMTFFLWSGDTERAVPDFIFRIVFDPPRTIGK